MGDSITEGTIVEWTAAVGQTVKADDVVALIETDKVTVDIKAEVDGVIVQHFGEVDDNVEVGASLYEIDTEAEGTVAAPAEAHAEESEATIENATAPGVNEDPTPVEAPPTKSLSYRKHSIHFLGKDGWAKRLSGIEEIAPSPLSSPTAVVTVQAEIHPMYGRPLFTEKEMEALIMGGAETAPKVVSKSSGARFAV
jgi:2-oxoglutarate dehydrogenase E2 component (dihydrolipoamide succinyltransferase)